MLSHAPCSPALAIHLLSITIYLLFILHHKCSGFFTGKQSWWVMPRGAALPQVTLIAPSAFQGCPATSLAAPPPPSLPRIGAHTDMG